MPGLTTACCADCRLNRLASILGGNTAYTKRDLGTPFDFIINQGELLVWHSKLTGFPADAAPISDALVLLHTDCLAVQKNAFFTTLRIKRLERYDPTHEGDIAFCCNQLEKIRKQTARLTGPIVMRWHFGIIDTDKAVQLTTSSLLNEALACIIWPFGTPNLFESFLAPSTGQPHRPTHEVPQPLYVQGQGDPANHHPPHPHPVGNGHLGTPRHSQEGNGSQHP